MPMGPGGTDVDMVTGKPLVKRPEDKASEAKQHYRQTVLEAYEISASLHQNNAVLKVFLEQYQKRLEELAKNDPTGLCQSLEACIYAIRDKLELKPIMARRQALRVLGPQVASYIEDSAAAPEGIPAE